MYSWDCVLILILWFLKMVIRIQIINFSINQHIMVKTFKNIFPMIIVENFIDRHSFTGVSSSHLKNDNPPYPHPPYPHPP